MSNNERYNSSGCLDLTAYNAIRNVERERRLASYLPQTRNRERRQKPPRNRVSDERYPRTYICSPLRGDVQRNTVDAIRYCRFALERGRFPIAPHIWLPRFMNDDNQAERELALNFGMRLLYGCREVWVFGARISDGMRAEIAEAQRRRIPVRYFTADCEEVPVAL
jgi:hypothetical protein